MPDQPVMCDDEDDIPTITGSASTSEDADERDEIPGFYIPDPDTRRGYRLFWVKRKPGEQAQRRRIGFGP